jgi:hypothetical protein
MSREKVEKYKEQKVRRKELLEKEKKKKKMVKAAWILTAVLAVGLVSGAIGLTIYNQYKEHQKNLPNYTASDTMIVEDLAGMLETASESNGQE